MKVLRTTVWVEMEEDEGEEEVAEIAEDFDQYLLEGDILGYRIELEDTVLIDETALVPTD